MTRKDLIAIAETIFNLNLSMVENPAGEEIQREMIAKRFADMLALANPLFNRALFIQAATGVVKSTARKAIHVEA